MTKVATHRRSLGILPIIAGLLSGAVGAFVVSRFEQRSQVTREVTHAVPVVQTADQAAPTARPVDDAERRNLEFRLGRLEAHAVEQTKAANAVRDAVMPDMSDGAMAAVRLEEQRRFDAFSAQSVDTGWAYKVSKPLEEDIARLADSKHFKVVGVECRGDSCLVKAAFPSSEMARSQAVTIAHEPLRVNCPRRVVLAPDTDNAPGEVRMLLDCSEWKAQGSQLLPALPAPT